MQKRQVDVEYIEQLLDREFAIIFKGEDIDSLSNYEKRKCIYDYLVRTNRYDYQLLNSKLNRKPQYPAEEVLAPLGENEEKGAEDNEKKRLSACNGLIYAYKLLLEKAGILSLLCYCKIEFDDLSFLRENGVDTIRVRIEDNGRYALDHMNILVKNDDGSYSFDDPTCENLPHRPEISFFDYDLDGARRRNQVEQQGFSAIYITAIVKGKVISQSDEVQEQRLRGNDEFFLNLPANIRSYSIRDMDSEQGR